MIPLKLSIQGMYSYTEKQTIDFENLTKAGIFGIFGKVGSGKSTIIDAMLLALYGKTERVGKSEGLLNLRSKNLQIVFECKSDNNKRFKFIVEYSRNKKGDVGSQKRTCYVWSGSTWEPQPDNDSFTEENVTGLSLMNFKRAVIIPQGQFMDFLNLTSANRTEVIMDLFNLEKFDLAEQVSTLQTIVNNEIQTLEGLLLGIGTVNPEDIENTKRLQVDIAVQLEEKKKTLDDCTKLILELSALYEEQKKMNNLVIQRNELLNKSEDFKQKRMLAENIRLCDELFSEKITLYEKNQQDIKRLELDLQDKTTNFSNREALFLKLKDSYEKIKEEYVNLSNYEKQTIEMEDLLRLRDEKLKSSDLAEKIVEIKKKITLIDDKLNSEKEAENTIKKQITDIELQKKDINELYAHRKELDEYLKCCTEIEEQRKYRDELNEEVKNIRQQIKQNLVDCGINTAETPSSVMLTIENKIKEIETEQERNKNHIVECQAVLKLQTFRNNLKEGDVCPLCGSKHHDVDSLLLNTPDLSIFKDEEIRIKNKISSLRTLQLSVQNHLATITEKSKLDEKAGEKMHELTIKRNLSEPDFACRNLNDFDKQIQECNEQNKLIEKLRKDCDVLLKNMENESSQKENCRKQSEDIERTQNQLKGSILSLKQKVSDKIENDNKDKSVNDLKQLIENRKLYQEKTNKKYTELSNQFEVDRESVERLKNEIDLLHRQLESLKTKGKNYSVEIEKQIKANNMQDIPTVLGLLTQKTKLMNLLHTIEEYDQNLKTVLQNISDSEIRLQGKIFDEKLFETKQQQKVELEKQKEELSKEKVRIDEQIKLLIDKQQKCEKTNLLLEEKRTRKSNIDELRKMFQGKGFVNYMSIRYLKMLCEIANKRFRKLTDQSLQLVYNEEKKDFYIQDFQNDGQLRSVQSLSGGQLFQVALSLALALSETLRLNSSIGSDFFFIDEGFGSQDKESLSVIFNTLSGLQKEGKTLGIISHVEALKENVPYCINVEKSDSGSIIRNFTA